MSDEVCMFRLWLAGVLISTAMRVAPVSDELLAICAALGRYLDGQLRIKRVRDN